MKKNTFYSSLVISSETLSSKDLTDIFGEAKSFDKEELVSSKPGSSKRERSVWSRRSSLSEQNPLAEHVAELVSFLETKKAAIEDLNNTLQFDIWCMVSHEKDQCGFSFEAKDLGALSRLGANLIFDVYR